MVTRVPFSVYSPVCSTAEFSHSFDLFSKVSCFLLNCWKVILLHCWKSVAETDTNIVTLVKKYSNFLSKFSKNLILLLIQMCTSNIIATFYKFSCQLQHSSVGGMSELYCDCLKYLLKKRLHWLSGSLAYKSMLVPKT